MFKWNAFSTSAAASRIEYGAIGMRSRHGRPVRLREIDESLVVIFGRAELLGELLRRQILLVIRTGWIGDLQRLELIRVAKGNPIARLSGIDRETRCNTRDFATSWECVHVRFVFGQLGRTL
jgi:hypothetical protein